MIIYAYCLLACYITSVLTLAWARWYWITQTVRPWKGTDLIEDFLWPITMLVALWNRRKKK